MHLDRDVLQELESNENPILRVTDFRVFTAPTKDEFVYAKVKLRHLESNMSYHQILQFGYKTGWMFGDELFTYTKLAVPPEPNF